jgi:hypothetical protein
MTIGGACTNPNIVQTLHYMLGKALVLVVDCVCVGITMWTKWENDGWSGGLGETKETQG